MTNATYMNRHEGDYFSWAKAPGFHPLKLVTVLAGFAIFPPLGIAALVYFLWMGRRGWGGPRHGFARAASCGRSRGHSGNRAFDEHQAKILSDLEDERRAFREHQDEQRRKRDQEAYDAFRAAPDANSAKPAEGTQ
jgi:Protein of unknown function (DUF2852)